MDISSFFQSNSVQNTNLKFNVDTDNKKLEHPLKQFLDGEVVKGEVIDIKGLIATILTEKGETLQGQLQNIGQLSIGEERSFLVKNDEGIVKFAIIAENDDVLFEKNLKNELIKQGISTDTKTIELVKNLLKNELPINKETISLLNRAVTILGKDSESLEKAMYLLKNEIPVNSKNANMLNQFFNKEINSLNNTNTILNDINSLKNGETKNELIKIFSSGYENILSEELNGDEHKTNISNNETKDIPKDILKESLASVSKEEVKNTQTQNLSENSNEIIKESVKKVLSNNTQLLEEDFILDELVKNNKSDIKEQIKEFEKLPLKDILKFTPKGDDPEEIDLFLNKTRQKLDEAIKVLENPKDMAEQKLLQTLTVQRDSIDFMQYAKNNVYLQFPVNINGKETNAELLVFKDKKSKNKGKNGVSAIIGLDTVSLGRYETYIQRIDNKINLQFRLENEDVIALTKKNLPKLEELIKPLGLNIESVSYKNIENSFTIITTEEQNEDIAMPSVKFDVKL